MLPIGANSLLNFQSDVGNSSSRVSLTSENSFKFKKDTYSPGQSSSFIDSDNFTTNEGVFSMEFFEKNSFSTEYPTVDLLTRGSSMKIDLRKSSDGRIKPIQKWGSPWIRYVKLAPDVHSPNSVLELSESRNVRLRTIKNIPAGEEIVCWFSQEILTLMCIPFLTPSNIIGNDCYRCHICQKSFDTPNPLKIHLAITCGQQPADILWTRLHYALSKMTIMPSALSRESSSKISESFSNQVSVRARYIPTASIVTSRAASFNQPLAFLTPSAPPSASAAAQIETIVSNMGSSKQGHLCIYCGKIYSRKYGLKIHIRTHTGFKPLKCKFCLRPFGDPSNLNKHVRLHMQSGNPSYRCRFCDKALIRKRDLHRHIQTVHGDKPESMNLSSSSDDD